MAETFADTAREALAVLATDDRLRGRLEFMLGLVGSGATVRVWAAPGFAPWRLVGLSAAGALAIRVDDLAQYATVHVVRFHDIEFPPELGGCENARAALASAPVAPGAH